MINIFLYNVVYIKCDVPRLASACDGPMVLIASPYCLERLSPEYRSCFDAIHPVSRDFQQVDFDEVDAIVSSYVDHHGASNLRLLTNEDSTQLVCASLREKYNIPGHHSAALLPFVNKVISKELLENCVNIPKFIKFDKESYFKQEEQYIQNIIEYLGFPMFVKPVDLVSSVETHFIPDEMALNEIVARIMQHPYDFEIDEYIEGDLFHCDAMIIDDSIEFFMVGKCSFALARFFDGKPVGSIPIDDEALFNKLKMFCNTVFEKLNCHSGAYHLEAFLDKKTNEFIFLEIGARTGGALITKVYERLFGFNIEETNFLIQMGLIKKLDVTPKKIIAGFLNFPHIKGTVLAIKRPNIDIEHEFIRFVQPNDRLNQAENLLDISSSIIFWDESFKKVEQTFEYLKNYNPLIFDKTIQTNSIEYCET